jgi:ribosomal protein L7/L12
MDVDDFARKRILELEARVAELEHRLGIVRPQVAGASPSVLAHLRDGNLLAAIQAYRAEHGCDLATAKHAVESLAASLR